MNSRIISFGCNVVHQDVQERGKRGNGSGGRNGAGGAFS